MRDILSGKVIDFLRAHYMDAVENAVCTFDMSSADEDSLTGALGQALAMPRERCIRTIDGSYTVDIGYRKLRGRGANAPERKYGSDGIFQIRVLDESGSVIRMKGLPFQSKKGWRGTLKKLADQANDMEVCTPGGVVIDFDRAGYSACMASDVVRAKGNRAEVERLGEMRTLGSLLGDYFLECKIGELNLYYDTDKEIYKIEGDGFHIITTEVKAR